MPKGFDCILLHLNQPDLKRFFKILKWFFLTLLFLLVALYIFIQTPFGQNWIGRQVTKRLSRDLQTKISIRHVSFSLFNKMHLEGILIEDQKGDTLLYAGDMQVRITDWFFMKKEADLKYIGLEDALIKFQRTDSVWSQQFLFDYFSSPSDTAKKKKAGLKLNLKKVEMKNVTFLKKDQWLGADMTIKLKSLDLDADKLSLSGNIFDVNKLLVLEPVVALRNYGGRKPKDTLTINDVAEELRTAVSWNKGKTIFRIGDMKIVNGTFSTDKETNREPFAHFDGKHILFTNINADLNSSRFEGDTIFSKLKLTAKERSGLEVKNLIADVTMTPQGMAFANMDLATNRSVLKHYFSMSYDDMKDLGYFINRVKLAAVFDDSYVDSDDIALFAPALATWKKKITLKGKIRGTVSDLVGREMVVQAGNSTILNGDISMTGLPDINQTFIDFKANDFRTTYSDAVTIVPAIRRITNPDLRNIRYVNFKGSFTGFIRDFVTYGTIETNLGTLTSDINMKLPKGQDAVYSGTIATNNFQLGQFLGDKKIGAISLTGTLKGKGFNEKSRNTFIDGTVRFVDYNNYRYENITVKGQLNKKLFEGLASMRDKNADLDLNGVIDFNGETPRFDLVADVNHANLRNLKLLKDSVTFKGKLNFNFTSSTLDNFLGYARISNAELQRNGTLLPFDSLVLTSSYTDGIKTLTAESNEFKAKVEGEFNIKDLPNAFLYFLHKYYPAYIAAPKTYPKSQNIRFDITTYYADELLKLFASPDISGISNSRFQGGINLAENKFSVTADIPQFRFRQYNFDSVRVEANGNADSLVLTGNTRNIHLNDSLNIPLANFRISARNDSSRVEILTGANQTVEKADLHALVLTYQDGVKIEFEPSNFTINGKLWTIDESGELVFRSRSPASGLLVLSEGDQRISLRTQPGAGNWNDLKVELTKINLGDFAPYFMPKNRVEGLLSGNIMVQDPTGDLNIKSDDLQTEFFRLDNDSLGQIKTSLEYDKLTKTLRFKGGTLNQENALAFNGTVFIGDKNLARNNKIVINAKEYPISILERFLGALFTDMQGFLTGDVNLQGAFDQLTVTGKGKLRDAGLRVVFTQCFYKINDTEIELKPTEINLDGIVLTDVVTKNPIYLSGGIEHESFKNMFYALDISTKKPNSGDNENFNKPVQLLNTTYKDNKQFYGNVKGTGSLTLAGPQSGMYMKIDAFASAKDSSNITLPSFSSRETGIADFLVERKYGREMNDSDVQKTATSIIYDVDVTANPMVNVRVVLDELTGDEINGRGSGNLNIRSGTSEPLSLRGRFDITQGKYDFTFQSFFKKPFELRGSENYIEWNGDPYDANIKFEAQYKAENVSFAPLANLVSTTQNTSNARGEVFVVAKLTDKLFKPQIEFSLDFPSTSVAVTNPELALVLQQMQRNTNELNRQVTYLIVFNSFAPSELAGDVTSSGIGLGTISGILLNVLSDQINKILSNLLKSEKYKINLNTSFYDRGIIDPNNPTALNIGSNVNFSIGRSFFNNRFIITAGGGFDAALQQSAGTTQQSFLFLKDVMMEWLINESGSMRVSFFYRENADYLGSGTGGSAKANRIGANISYRRDFDNLREFFNRKKRKPAQAPSTEQKPEAKKEEEPKPVGN
ncbi:MAG: translocation/assembly module TamB domain-containing protein [Chitinophagaceae bacterium]|nr:translocation/assembly module TamB domain-containing protein [Chitinophagaceae bacterium]